MLGDHLLIGLLVIHGGTTIVLFPHYL
jgi:hypothetical protein